MLPSAKYLSGTTAHDSNRGSGSHIYDVQSTSPTPSLNAQTVQTPGDEELTAVTAAPQVADKDESSLQNASLEADTQSKEVSLARLLLTICILSLALFIAAVDQTIVATATVRISEEFDALSQAPWLANAYLLSSTALQPTTGKLSDIFGRTPILVCSLVVFAVGSLVCALAHSIAVLLVGRAIAGAGSAGIIGLTLVIVADIVPMRKRGPYMAVFSLVFSLSSVIGPLLGGFFTDHVSWRWIFWLSEPITGFVIIAVFFLLRLPRPSSDIWAKLRRIDYLGIVLLVGGLVAILMGLNLPNSSHSWKSPEVIVCLVLGTVVIGAFLAVEWRFAADPVVPLRLFRVRNVASMMAASFFMGACLFIPVYYVPIYYNVVRDTTSTIAGIYLLPFVVGIMITSIASGFLVAKFGKYRLYMWSGTALCTVGLGLLALLQKDSGMAAKICYLLIAGLGVGSFIQLSLIAAQAAVSVKDMASTTAVLSFFRSIGSVVGMAVTQTVFLNALRDKIHPLEHEYHMHNKIVISSYNNPSVIYDSDVPEGLRDAIIDAYMHSLRLVFLSMIAFGGLMFLSTLPLEHKVLAKRLEPVVAE